VTRFVGPHLLTRDHTLDGFDCGDQVLNDWLTQRARRNQAQGASRTWVVTDGRRVVAFYASSTAVIMRAEATKRAARNQPDPLPALLLGRLAVDVEHQGAGLGAALLKHFFLKALDIAELTGVRVLLVHARNDDVVPFYRRYGFEPSPIDPRLLILPVKDLRG
jgi:GNAT superfamily N-acetyltransferase